MHAKVFTFTLMCTAFFLFYFAKTTWNFRKPGDETARRAKCWRKPRARPHSTRPVTVIWHTHYQTFSYWFLDSCERSSMHTAKPFYTTPRVSSTDLYCSDRDGAQRGGGGFAKEDVYENLSWKLSENSRRDMKERAASQCMERTHWDSDMDGMFQRRRKK